MEPSAYGTEDAVRYWPVDAGNTDDQLLATTGDSFDEKASSNPFEPVDLDKVRFCSGDQPNNSITTASTTRTWYQLDEFQLCQLGELTAVPGESWDASAVRKCSIFQRRFLIRRTPLTSSPRRQSAEDVRTISLFHFKSVWKKDDQVQLTTH